MKRKIANECSQGCFRQIPLPSIPLSFLFLFCLAGFLLPPRLRAAEKLNIITIVADDTGWGDVGFHGSKIRTPTLDKLAKESVRLERFYVNPICSVTRAAMMTGQFTRRTGVNNRNGLSLDYRTMPQDFRDAGWQTWMCGKWHLGGPDENALKGREFHPDKRGFVHFYGLLGGAVDYYTHENRESGGLDWWRNGAPVKEEGYSTDLLAAEAVKLIRQRDKAKPFYLHLAFNAAHGPLNPPPGSSARKGDAYTAVVEHMDAAIGKVLATLDAENLDAATLVVFFCDNGAQEGRGGSNAPLRGFKGNAYEGGVRSAALARGPGLKPGTQSQQWMFAGDLWPTFAAAAGLTAKPAKPFDGINLWPALTKGETMQRPGIEVGSSDLAWISAPWKLIQQPGGTRELYDLVNDPGETKNLASEKPDIVARLAADWEKATGGVRSQGGGGKGGKEKRRLKQQSR